MKHSGRRRLRLQPLFHLRVRQTALLEFTAVSPSEDLFLFVSS